MHLIRITKSRTWILIGGIALLLHGALATVAAANVTLAWDRNSDSDISGYKVYYGTSSRTYPFVLDSGNTTTQFIDNLQSGITYYFAVTAYNADGQESDFSGELPYPVPVPLHGISALGDGSFRIRFEGLPERTYRVEYTESLTAPNWRTLGMGTAGSNGLFEIIDRPIGVSSARFYRSVYPAR